MTWAMLVLAGLFEVGWAIGLKYTEGFTRVWPTLWTVLAMILSLWLLGIAMKGLPVGTAYSVWVGVGAVGTVILGIVLVPLNQRIPARAAWSTLACPRCGGRLLKDGKIHTLQHGWI